MSSCPIGKTCKKLLLTTTGDNQKSQEAELSSYIKNFSNYDNSKDQTLKEFNSDNGNYSSSVLVSNNDGNLSFLPISNFCKSTTSNNCKNLYVDKLTATQSLKINQEIKNDLNISGNVTVNGKITGLTSFGMKEISKQELPSYYIAFGPSIHYEIISDYTLFLDSVSTKSPFRQIYSNKIYSNTMKPLNSTKTPWTTKPILKTIVLDSNMVIQYLDFGFHDKFVRQKKYKFTCNFFKTDCKREYSDFWNSWKLDSELPNDWNFNLSFRERDTNEYPDAGEMTISKNISSTNTNYDILKFYFDDNTNYAYRVETRKFGPLEQNLYDAKATSCYGYDCPVLKQVCLAGTSGAGSSNYQCRLNASGQKKWTVVENQVLT